MDAAHIETILPDGSSGPALETRKRPDGKGREFWIPQAKTALWAPLAKLYKRETGKPLLAVRPPDRRENGIWCPESWLMGAGIRLPGEDGKQEPISGEVLPPVSTEKTALRKAPKDDAQQDFFVPMLHDVATKDSRSIMDVAVFRLSKKDKRAGDVIRYELSDGYVEVTGGPQGMASAWDYDIVLMAISHLTEANNRYKAGRGEKPSRTFRPHVAEILKYCRKSKGGRQYEEIESALHRLKTTTIKVVRVTKKGGRQIRIADEEGLIGHFQTISYLDTGRVGRIEIELPKWVYKEVVEGEDPGVLTVHPDYFLIEPGLGRFLYRVARRAAGKENAGWLFRTLFDRSGSTGQFKRFTYELRKLIKANDLPEYNLMEEEGQEGPLLIMTHRSSLPVIGS